MPNLVDIVEIAESLESKAVHVADDRCVVVRNRNVTCRKCQAVCPADAFTIGGNKLVLDHSACVSCGACTVVCPTQALIPLRPLDAELAHSIADACLNNEGVAVFACARIASKKRADPDTFAGVPCLARLEESILVELAAQSVDQILLVDGDCSTCKYHACDEGITKTVNSVNMLIGAMGGSTSVERQTSFPESMLVDNAAELYGAARRDFFSNARGTAKDAAQKSVETVLLKNEGEKVASLRERLGVTGGGALPRFGADRRVYILDSMDRIGECQVEEINTRLWGNISIDTELCNACHMCTVFCPTGALEKIDFDDDTTGIEFSMADCVQCRTCEDICLKKCLKVGTVVPMDELFDFEPRIIELPAKKKTRLFGFGK